jgi:hypothetical protein
LTLSRDLPRIGAAWSRKCPCVATTNPEKKW